MLQFFSNCVKGVAAARATEKEIQQKIEPHVAMTR